MKRMRKYIQKHNLIQNGDKIVVAFSGGPDSVYLLLELLKMKQEKDLSIVAVHINHKLQAIAKEHASFVKDFCKRWQVELYYFEKDIQAYAKEKKLSLEEAGRLYRYKKFREVKQMLHYDKIAVAHHQDDRAETVLYRMARGTGWKGLSGIRPMQDDLIRPMLELSKKDILKYLEKENQVYNIDPSNEQTIYARNQIRHKVIPNLQEVNAQAVLHITELAEQMEEIGAYLEMQIMDAYGQVVEEKKEVFVISLKELFGYPEFLQKEILKKALVLLSGQEKDLTRKHIEQLMHLAYRQSGKMMNLPYEVIAKKEYEFLYLQKKREEILEEIVLKGEGVYIVPFASGVLNVQILQKNQEISQKMYTKSLDYDRIKECLRVRTYRDGDYFIMNQRGQRKRLNRYFIDQKIPSEERKRIPLVMDGSHAVWVIGGRISEAYKITQETKTVLQLSWKFMEEE